MIHSDEHQLTLLDARIEELNRLIEDHRILLEQVRYLESKAAGRELPFFAGRRSMARELRESGGLPQGQMGLEILFLLPDNFVEFYQGIFHRALRVGDGSVMHGRSGGVEKAKGTTGTVLGSETRAQASGTGKKFKRMGLVIGNEKVLQIKDQTDKGLEQLTSEGRRAIGELEGAGAEGGSGGSNKPGKQPQCYACKGFVGRNWRFCSMCGNSLAK